MYLTSLMDTSIFEASFNPNFYLGHMKYRMFFPVCVHHISCQKRRSKSFLVKGRKKDVGNESINILFCKHNFSLDSLSVFSGEMHQFNDKRKSTITILTWFLENPTFSSRLDTKPYDLG